MPALSGKQLFSTNIKPNSDPHTNIIFSDLVLALMDCFSCVQQTGHILEGLKTTWGGCMRICVGTVDIKIVSLAYSSIAYYLQPLLWGLPVWAGHFLLWVNYNELGIVFIPLCTESRKAKVPETTLVLVNLRVRGSVSSTWTPLSNWLVIRTVLDILMTQKN